MRAKQTSLFDTLFIDEFAGGGFVGISIMALMNVAKEADKQIGADEGERRIK